ncbi:cdc42 effector protein 1 [Paramormyrops kingsleyae]|nr:cdc42 effector protein 1-like [Paramormyrops kingsleyae]
MNLGKLSGIKGLVSSSQGKRRFKGDLTAEMISPPLGDFRHTMHVGRGGDVFGDTSFLSNHGGAVDPDSSPEKTSGLLSRTFRHVLRTPTRPVADTADLSTPPPLVSPIIKNAISLPRLDVDTPNGCLKRELFPNSPSCPEGSMYSYGVDSGFATLPRLSRIDGQLQDSPTHRSPEPWHESPSDYTADSLVRSDSLISFTVDLGPSLMSEVFGIIDSPDGIREAGLWWEGEGPANSCDATHLSTNAVADSPQGVELNGRERSDQEWEEGENGDLPKPESPGTAVKSPGKVEPGMEAERFLKAADVLSRHYGGGGVLKRPSPPNGRDFSPYTGSGQPTQRRSPCPDPEEDEIKV